MTYREHTDCIIRLSDGGRIPRDEGNRDYRVYLAWLDAGGVLEPAPAPTRDELKAAATAKRWEVETGGITLPNGVEVHTAKDDQDRITSTIAGMAAVGIASVDFKAASGWTTLTLDDLRAVRAAIALHVQACFSAERAHHETIDALTDAELDAYDISQGWPA